MRILMATFVVLSTFVPSLFRTSQSPEDWKRAEASIVRLPPEAFPGIGPQIRKELERRGCLIPQNFSSSRPHNVVRGRFMNSGRPDLVVLCSRQKSSSILVFRGGLSNSVVELAGRPDADFLQQVGPGGRIAYSRALGVADPASIRHRYEVHGEGQPPPFDHDGIEDIFLEKASSVWYWSAGRWLHFVGAD